tara:strand:- start:2246 stop:3079 length:834 start_codon:yes stop_codon:yes gene_type:complete
MKKYLVIGNPIEHSLSPLIQNYWMKKYGFLDSVYEKRKVEEKNLNNIIKEIRNNEIVGANVTVPFKKIIIKFLDKLDPTAKKTESVNTLLKIKDKIVGFNTDQPGFGLTIRELFSSENKRKKRKTLHATNIFILGSGGVTSSIIDVLEQEDANIFLSNRTKKKAEDLKKKYSKIEVLDWGKRPSVCDIVINTTSIGLTENEKINIDFSDCKNDKNKLFYDLIYNPKETNFLRDARLRGNKTMNGQMMFLNQAMYAFKLWTNITPDIDKNVIKLLDND